MNYNFNSDGVNYEVITKDYFLTGNDKKEIKMFLNSWKNEKNYTVAIYTTPKGLKGLFFSANRDPFEFFAYYNKYVNGCKLEAIINLTLNK